MRSSQIMTGVARFLLETELKELSAENHVKFFTKPHDGTNYEDGGDWDKNEDGRKAAFDVRRESYM
jgi:hypothetical protein